MVLVGDRQFFAEANRTGFGLIFDPAKWCLEVTFKIYISTTRYIMTQALKETLVLLF